MPGFYNRLLAVGYASTYAYQYNKAWIADKNDCTNFVSQALYFGGWPMTAGDGFNEDRAWYNLGEPTWWLPDEWERSNRKRSASWASAANLSRFLQISGRARRCKIDELVIGDVVQHADQNKNVHHTMMITALAPSTPSTPATSGLNGIVLLMSYHQKDRLNYPLFLQSPPAENLFWKIFDKAPDTGTEPDAVSRQLNFTGKNWSR